MTDIDALAEGLDEVVFEPVVGNRGLLTITEAAQALAATPPVAAILEKAAKWDRYYSKAAHDELERLASVGRAVERLPEEWLIWRDGSEWVVSDCDYVWDRKGESLPALIDAVNTAIENALEGEK